MNALARGHRRGLAPEDFDAIVAYLEYLRGRSFSIP